MDPAAVCNSPFCALVAPSMKRDAAMTNTSTSTLPAGVLPETFKHLGFQDRISAAQVCLSWRRKAYDPSLWPDVHMKISPELWTPSLVLSLDRLGIQHVTLARKITHEQLHAIVTRVSSLRRLEVSLTSPPPDGALDDVFNRHLQRLTQVDISEEMVHPAVTERICHHAKNLQTLRLNGVYQLEDSCLALINSNLRNLQELSLLRCFEISDEGIGALTGVNSYREVVNPLTSLQHLTLLRCKFVTNRAVEAISIGLPNLTSLNLWDCCSLDDQCLKYVATMARLERLGITTNLPTDSGLRLLSEGNLPNLADLQLGTAHMLTDNGLSHLVGFSSLRSLDIKASFGSRDVILEVVSHLDNLKKLRLECIKWLSAEDFQHIKNCLETSGKKIDVTFRKFVAAQERFARVQ